MPRTCDAIIGGGGMVGLTLALALARGGLKTVVVDTLPKSTVTGAAFDGRVSRARLRRGQDVPRARRLGASGTRPPNPSRISW